MRHSRRKRLNTVTKSGSIYKFRDALKREELLEQIEHNKQKIFAKWQPGQKLSQRDATINAIAHVKASQKTKMKLLREYGLK